MPRLIHLSDLHFGAHDPVLVEAVERRLDEEKPDLVVVSGDFTQRARTEQFEEAGAFLMRLREAGHEVLAVPGNHDVPLYDVLRRFLSPLTRYKRYIDDSLCPFIEIDGAAVLGINTARSLTFKNGHISDEQMAIIRETLRQRRRTISRGSWSPTIPCSRFRSATGPSLGIRWTTSRWRSTRSPMPGSICCSPGITTAPRSTMPAAW